MPVQRYKRTGEYKFNPEGGVFTCGTSDFFVEEADQWRKDAWAMMRERYDINFFIITKRIDRFDFALPSDWGEGYANISIGCTCENQKTTDYRLPIFLDLPIKHKIIIHGPMLEKINISKHLAVHKLDNLEEVALSGESTPGTLNKARVFEEDWICDTKRQCDAFNIKCSIHQLGSKFKYNKRVYLIKRSDEFRLAQKYMCLNKWGQV